ncbi:hypothetical protein [Burkholderia cenocepacia]|uniref:hypothetical protein n=1 Tax=Burkholderia cenocepacia TaxID=95486 RepID=UPI002865F69C|nr:hypothetical protein [Burkholderia cenocepacia]MDR5660987.1 hypothetical protein [Burkholderia cenocepacia]MDR8094145.1 hypothetical protein [Burkholderia cenocepacia]
MKRDQVDVSVAGEIQRHFKSHANLIGLHVNGLQGLTIYRDSQFELEWSRCGYPVDLKSIARAAFNVAVDERVVREFPSHPLTNFSRERLSNAAEAQA